MKLRRKRSTEERIRLREKFGMPIYILPNLFTTGSMFCGFFGIVSSIEGNFHAAAYAVVAAAVFDLLDGRVARATGTTSRFGAEYDSLSDLVSFGVSPGLLMFLWALQPFQRIGWLASFIFVACAALRLARFNVQLEDVESKDFQGLPTPMAAGIIASSVLAFDEWGIEASHHWGLLAMTFLLAFVMVTNFRYRSFKELDLRQRVAFKYLVLGVLLLVIIASRPEIMLFIVFLAYSVLGAVFGIFRLGKTTLKKRKIRKAGGKYGPE